MSQSEQTVFINFDNGLDAETNPHRLNPSAMSLAVGTALDRSGYIYPGPGYATTAWTQIFSVIYSAFGYATLAQGHSDFAVIWGLQPSTNLPLLTSWLQPDNLTIQTTNAPLYPFRQQEKALSSGDSLGTNNTTSITSPPQSATNANYQITVLTEPSGWYGIFTHLKTGAVSPKLLLLAGTGQLQWAVCANSLHLYLLVMTGGTSVTVYTYTIPEPLTPQSSGGIIPAATNAISLPSTPTILNICATGVASPGPGEPDAVGFALTASSGLWAFTGSGFTFSSPVLIHTLVSTTTPFSMSVGLGLSSINNDLLTPIGYLFITWDATNGTRVTSASLALGSLTTVTLTVPALISTDFIPTQLTVSYADGGANNICFAVEMNPASGKYVSPIGTPQATYPSVVFCTSQMTGSSSSDRQRPQTAWGGLALLGRTRLIQWAVSPDTSAPGTSNTTSIASAFTLVRTGWRATNGAWGTTASAGAIPAYPTAFLYDSYGNLVAKVGDSDCGSDSLWLEFATANYYNANNLPVLTEASVVPGTITQQGTLTYPFPQYFDFLAIADFASGSTTTVRADIGSIIGALPGPSLVTWTDANFLSPPAPPVQQGPTVTLAGALTAQFDGAALFEAGWLTATPTPLALLTSGGSLPVGYTAQYLAVAIFKDNNGKLYRGAPSFVCQSTPCTSGNQSNTIYVSDIFPTLKHLDGSNLSGGARINPQVIQFEIYRNVPTQANNTSFYRLPQILTSVGFFKPDFTNTPALNSGNFYLQLPVADTVLDQDLINCLQLYTTGQQQGAAVGTNNPLPFDCLAVWNNATWGIARRNGAFELWFTWPQDNNILRSEGPTWNENNRIPIPSGLGVPRAIVPMDTQLLILGSLADGSIQGNGPARSTTYADDNTIYSAPTALPGSGGIQCLNGITIIPQGVLFQGLQGFTLLDRSLSYTPVGNQVRPFTEAYNYQPGVSLPEMQAILLWAATPPDTFSGGVASVYPDLVYFYNQSEWAQMEHPLAPVQAALNLLPPNISDGTDTDLGAVTGFFLGETTYGNTLTGGETIAGSTSAAWQGTYSLLFDTSTNNTGGTFINAKFAFTGLALSTAYIFYCYVNPITGGGTGISIGVVDSTNTQLNPTRHDLPTDGVWTRLEATFTTGSSGSINVSIGGYSSYAGVTMYIDGCMLSLGSTALTWVEGQTIPAQLLHGPVLAAARFANANGTFGLLPVTTDGLASVLVNRYSQTCQWQTTWIELTPYTDPSTGGLAPIRNPTDYGSVREVQLLMDVPAGQTLASTTVILTTEYDYAGNTTTPTQMQTKTLTLVPGDTQMRFGLNASQCRRVRFTVQILTPATASDSNGNTPMVLVTGLTMSYVTDAGLSRLGTANS